MNKIEFIRTLADAGLTGGEVGRLARSVFPDDPETHMPETEVIIGLANEVLADVKDLDDISDVLARGEPDDR